ncbi:unnamed protein product [Onchocerca ochengi]|uniref:Uncharacterized protein n=1 Tax=Onchocerca ochengi TaxID=42157 RepID=A0A182ENE1_ONCOC|nr:unnamed protein product [Onchocerca ochengi]
MITFPRVKRFVLCENPPKGFNFCYYSIRILGGYWKLKRDFDTKNRALIQNCMKTTTDTYGFTYQVDLSERTYMYKMTDDEIVNFIGNLLLKNLPKPRSDIYNYIPGKSLPYCLLENGALATKLAGINRCVLLLDSCSANKIYVGPFLASDFDQLSQSTQRINKSLADVVSMNFTEICPKAECIYYLSPLEFFFYCCCDINFELCAYTTDEKLLSYASKNAETWANNPKIRSFQEVLIHNQAFNSFTGISGRPWMFRKYIYSKPTVNEQTENEVFSENNIPLHLCAIGTYNLTIGNWKNEDFTMKLGKRKLLAEPQKFCYYTASLQFEQTDRKPPTSLEMRYGSDTEEMCKKDGCEIKAPSCLQNLISTNHVTATFKCCCSTGDLCNHLGNRYFDVTEQLISTNENYNETVQHGCIRKIFLPFYDPFCKLFLPVLTNLIQCSCFQNPRLKKVYNMIL